MEAAEFSPPAVRRARMRCGSDAPNSEYDGRGVPRVGTSVPRVAKLRVPCPQGTIGVPKLYTWYILSSYHDT